MLQYICCCEHWLVKVVPPCHEEGMQFIANIIRKTYDGITVELVKLAKHSIHLAYMTF